MSHDKWKLLNIKKNPNIVDHYFIKRKPIL